MAEVVKAFPSVEEEESSPSAEVAMSFPFVAGSVNSVKYTHLHTPSAEVGIAVNTPSVEAASFVAAAAVDILANWPIVHSSSAHHLLEQASVEHIAVEEVSPCNEAATAPFEEQIDLAEHSMDD